MLVVSWFLFFLFFKKPTTFPEGNFGISFEKVEVVAFSQEAPVESIVSLLQATQGGG